MTKNKVQKNIPEGWQKKELGGVCNFVVDNRGKTPPIVDNGIPLIEVNAMGGKNINYNKINKFVSEDTFKSWFRKYLQNGDILFSTVGRTAMTSLYFDSMKACIAQNIVGLRFNEQDSTFMYYLLTEDRNNFQFKRIEMIAVQPSVKIPQMLRLKFNIPPLPEQKRIVGVLEVWDLAVEKLERKIVVKENIKKGLMQQLLTGKKRLPGLDGEWEEKKLGEVGSCLRGVNYKPLEDLLEKDTGDSFRLLRSNNVKDSKINMNDIQIVVSKRVKHIQALEDDDIVICMANGSKRLVGKSAIFKNSDEFEYTFGAFMGVFRAIKKNNISLIKYLFQTQKYRFYITNLLSGSSINNLKPSDIESLKFKIPSSLEEQKAIAEVLMTVDEEIEMLRKKLDKVENQKKYLLNNLVTGQIRILENIS